MIIAEPRRKRLDKTEVLKLLSEIADKPQEHFVVLTFDSGGRLIAKHVVYIGTIDKVPVHPRDVFARAMPDFPAGIIISHNHPGGDPTPSKQDITATQNLAAAGQLLGVPVLDHIIIAGDEYYSFVGNGLIFPDIRV